MVLLGFFLVGWFLFCFFFFFFLKKACTGTSHIDQAGLEFRVIVLPQIPKFWDCWHVLSCPVFIVSFQNKELVLWLLVVQLKLVS